MNPDTENPPVDFKDLAEAYGDESVALGMLEVFDTSMTSEAPLLHLLDAVLYQDFKEIKAQAHKLKGAASYANAKHMAEIAGVLQNAGINEDKATTIEKMKELIVEARRTHIYVCELLKVPKETIDAKINELYDILKVYINESNAEDHIDHVNLNDQYGDEEMGFMMLEKGAYKTFCEEDFFEKIFKELLEEEYPTLKMTAHTMKGRGNYLFLPMLVKVCKQLQESARDQNQEACFQSLIGVIDECFYIERYVNIKKLQKEEDTEKWIKLRPELILLLEKRNDLPSVIEEIKAQYQAGKRATREPGGDAKANAQENKPEASSEQVIVPQPGPEEIKLPQGSSSSSPVEGVVFFHPHFHETSMKTVLEPIPEEKEKEELKQNESMDDERRRSLYRDKMSERSSESELRANQKSPDSVRIKSNFAGLLDGQEENKADPQLNSFARSRSNILNVVEENKEEGVNLASNYNREPSYGDNIKNNEVNLDNGPASNRDKNSADDNTGAHIIISSKKKRNREERSDDDDYPFDTGLKCNMF